MSSTFRREYRDRLPLPLAQLYSRAHNAPDARSRHNNAFYLFEAAIKLAAAPAIAGYLRERARGTTRDTDLDRILCQLALPSLGQWVGILRELARHFGRRPDKSSHPFGHLADQLDRRRQDLPAMLALYRRIKNGPDGQPGDDRACSPLDLFDALLRYRNGVFGHGADRVESFYAHDMEPLLFGAVNEVFTETVFGLLGPPGSRLVYLTEIHTVAEDRVEVGLRELVGLQGERLAPLVLTPGRAEGLLPNRVAVLWPGSPTPLRLDPLLQFRESATAEEVLFLNRDRNGRQVEYLSYTTGRTERDRDMGPALAALLSLVAGKPVTEEQLNALAEQSRAESPSVEGLMENDRPTATILGDYEVLAELGRGGMGVVYLARQLSLGRLVALKTLPADLRGDPTALTRFQREIRALARCDHPNIVKVLTSGTLPDGQLYYTMEYVPGCDLEHVWRELNGTDTGAAPTRMDGSTWAKAVLSASRKQREETLGRQTDRTGTPPRSGGFVLALPPLPETPELPADPSGFVRRVTELARDAASALQAVHDQGLIHRDIKPANLMLTPDGQRVVLMDFGLAKSDAPTVDVSKGAGFLGTLRYAAPEQLAAATLKVGPTADVRALGAILWEFLSRRRLFGDAADEAQLAARVHDEDVPLLRSIDPALDRDLEAIVARATERSVSARLGSAGLMGQYLQMHLDSQPLPIRPPGTGELLGRWVRRHKALVAGVLVPLLFVLTVGIAYWIVEEAQKRADEQKEIAAQMKVLRDEAVNEKEAKEQQRKRAETNEEKAQKNEQEAIRQRERAARLQYAADISAAQQAFRENRLFRMREILLQYEQSEHLKGFEWHYLWYLCRNKLVFGPRHQKAVMAVAWSPDGRRVVSGSFDGAVKIWDAFTGKVLLSLEGHLKWATAVEFSPDGKLVASTTSIGGLKVWDSNTGQQLYSVTHASGGREGLAFSSDGRYLAVSGLKDTVIVCDAANGKQRWRKTGESGRVGCVTFSPNGKLLAATTPNTVQLWDVESGRLLQKLEGRQSYQSTAAFSPDGRLLASCDQNSGIILSDTATGEEVRRYTYNAEKVFGVSFNPDGRHVVSVGGGGTAWIHELGTDKSPTVLYGFGGTFWVGRFSPDGTRLLFGSDNGSAQVWDLSVDEAAPTASWRARSMGYELAQSPDGSWLAHGGDKGEVLLWDPLSGRKVRTFERHTGAVLGVAFSPDNRMLVSGGTDKVAKVWQVDSNRESYEFRKHEGAVVAVAFHPRDQLVATADTEGVIKVWDPRSGDELASLQRHKRVNSRGNFTGVKGLAFSPDGRRLASIGADQQLLLWDTKTWKVVRSWADLGLMLNGVVYCPDNVRVATTTSNGTVLVLDERRDKPILTLHGMVGHPFGLAITSDGRRLVCCGADEDCPVWELDTGQMLVSLRVNPTQASSLVFSPDNRRLAARHTNGVLIWDTADMSRPVGTAPYHWQEWHRKQFDRCTQKGQTTRWAAAAFHANLLRQTEPKFQEYYRLARAEVALEQRDWTQAIAEFTQLLELWKDMKLWKDNSIVLKRRADAHFALGQYDRAEADQTRALSSDPKYRGAWSARGQTRGRMGRWADAIADYTQALKLDPNGSLLWLMRGAARAELDQWDQAIADFTQALEFAPTGREELYNLSVAYLGRGDLPGYRRACVSMYERLKHSNQPTHWNGIAWICCLSSNVHIEPAQLVRLMDKAVEAEPKKYAFLNTRGMTLYRAGRHDDAVRQLTQTIEDHGKGGAFEDWIVLAMARFKRGDVVKAADDLKQAIKLYDEGLKPANPKVRAVNWSTRVEWQHLRKEAESLLQAGKP